VIDGRYSLEEQIGIGGMATVWRATDTLLDRQLAIKRLSPHLKSDRAASDRFRREGQAAARLNHPGILTVFDAGEDEAGPWIAMELIEGETLAKRLAASGRMDLATVGSFIGQVAAAVDYAHANGIVHRDIKPANLMIEPGGRIRLADFGIAKPLDDPATITSPGEMVGTISYVAPELIAGGQASPSSDIYSLAAVAYEMLTGEKPYTAETTAGLLEMIRRGEGPDLGKVPAEAAPALGRGMARDPARRPGSAGAFASELSRQSTLVLPVAVADVRPKSPPELLAGSSDATTVLVPPVAQRSEPVTAVASGPVTTGTGTPRRAMALAGGLSLAVLVAVLALAFDNPAGYQENPEPPSTTIPAPTTTSTGAESTTVTETTPASLAAAIGGILAGLDPPEYKPKDLKEVEDRVDRAVDQWGTGQRERAAASLEDAFSSLENLPASDERDELFDLLNTLAEEMGFQVASDDDD
jgi:serine/threonine protein kinase